MSKCTNIRPIDGCFKPNDGSDPINIIIHIIYDLEEKAIGQVYTLANTETPIDPTTYLGGGVVSVGSCSNYHFLHKEVCGRIDGGVECYEIFKVEKRDSKTGKVVDFFYENKKSEEITGVVEEVCCTCDCLCDLPTFNRLCFGYSSLFNGNLDFPNDKHIFGADYFIEYLEVDGNVIVNSSTPIGSTTPGATMVDMGYGLAYNKTVDLLNSNSFIQGAGIEFITAGDIIQDTGWGVKYDDTKDIKLVLRDYIPVTNELAYWSIRLNPDPNETYDAIVDIRNTTSWSYADASNYTNAFNLQSCVTL